MARHNTARESGGPVPATPGGGGRTGQRSVGDEGKGTAATMMELRGIEKSYAVGPVTVDVLRGVDLEIRPGDLLSIMGPSGCGKSTLLNIMGLLDQPTAGTYSLNGRNVVALDDDEISSVRNANVGFVFQSFHLLPRMTAAENAGLPLVYRGCPEAEIAERALATT